MHFWNAHWDPKKSTMTKPTKTGPSKIDPENAQVITRDLLKDIYNVEFKTHMRHYEELCLASYGQTKNEIFKKSLCPRLSKSHSQSILNHFGHDD
jgi:hypothetical protein